MKLVYIKNIKTKEKFIHSTQRHIMNNLPWDDIHVGNTERGG
jgi:hypothetical protein